MKGKARRHNVSFSELMASFSQFGGDDPLMNDPLLSPQTRFLEDPFADAPPDMNVEPPDEEFIDDYIAGLQAEDPFV